MTPISQILGCATRNAGRGEDRADAGVIVYNSFLAFNVFPTTFDCAGPLLLILCMLLLPSYFMFCPSGELQEKKEGEG